MAKPPHKLALPEIDLEEKVVEVRVRLKGRRRSSWPTTSAPTPP
jgi:hypothetical protein